VYLRALRLAAVSLHGIIGIWPYTGVPAGWEVLNLNDCYLQLDNTGTGSVDGDNTLGLDGTTGSSSHLHYPNDQRTTQTWDVSEYEHMEGVAHAHMLLKTVNFSLSKLNVKLIQFKRY
jgi:hypothetical protein